MKNEAAPVLVQAAKAPDVEQLPGVGMIHAAIAAIMAEVGGVGKTRENKAQGYKFRGIADIKLACQPLMAKHHVHMTPHAVLNEEVSERTTKSGGAMMHVRQRIEFRFYHADGSYFPCVTTGEAMDSGDKASNKAMSAAMKYALDQVFCLPEEDPEADTEHSSPEIGTKKATASTAPKVTTQGPADPLTNEDITMLYEAGKAINLTREDWAPILTEHGGGASGMRAVDRTFLGGIMDHLKRRAQPKSPTPEEIAEDVAAIFGPETEK